MSQLKPNLLVLVTLLRLNKNTTASGCKTWTGKLQLHSLTHSHGNVNAKLKSGATRSLVKRSLYSTRH